MKILIVIGLFIATGANAETRLHIGGFSYHPFGKGHNSNHQMLVIEHRQWLAGRAVNSYDEEIWMAGYRLMHRSGDWSFSVMPAVIYGYRSCRKGISENRDRRVCPGAIFAATHHRYRLEPSVGNLADAVVLITSVRF